MTRWCCALALAGCAGSEDDEPTRGRETGETSGTTSWTTPAPLPGVTDVQARLHDRYPSLVRVSWAQDAQLAVHLEFSFDAGVWHTTPVRDLDVGRHEELLLGVPYATDVTWRIVARGADGVEVASSDQVARTPAPPDLLPRAELMLSDPDRFDAATTHLLVAVNEGEANSTGSWTMLLDRRGRVSWAHRSPAQRHTMHPRITWDRDGFLIDHSSFFTAFDGGAASEVLELKIDGAEVRRWVTPGQHHPFTDLPDGSLAYAAYVGTEGEGRADDDVITVLDPAGRVRTLLGCSGFLASIGEDDSAFCGSNTLSYEPTRQVFLFSLFTHDTVIEVDAASGAANRWFGRMPGSWAFEPAGSQFDYQHGSVYLASGNLLVSTHSSADTTELAVREYALDEASEALVEVWRAGVGLGINGRQKGEAHRLPGGNTLHNYGTHARLREFAPDGDVVWEVRWEAQEYGADGARHSMGRSAPIQEDLYVFLGSRP